MATHDYVIDNSTGANVRADLNSVLQAILTNNSSSSAPSTTAAYMWWADTSAGILKIRNSANNAWVELLQLDGTLTMEDGSASTPGLAFRNDLNTGLARGGADILNLIAGGDARLKLGATTIFNDSGADVDFRIEGDTEANLFYVDAGNERIGLTTSSPRARLDLGNGISVATSITRLAERYQLLLDASDTSNAFGNNIGFILNGGTTVVACINAIEEGGNGSTGLSFATSSNSSSDPVEALRIDESGNVGIGTSSPARRLHVEGSDADEDIATFKNTNTTSGFGVNIQGGGSDSGRYILRLAEAGGNEKLRVDSSGRLLAGSTSTANSGRIQGFIGHGSTAGESGITSVDTTSMAAGVGGEISFYGKTSSSGYNYLGHVRGIKENGTDSNTACALTFHTRPTLTAPQERMRIDSSGKVGIGTTSPVSILHLHEAGASGSPIIQFSNGDTGATSGDGFAIGVADNESPFIYNRENTDLRFGTNNTERMRLTSTGTMQVSNTGAYSATDPTYHEFLANSANDLIMRVTNTSSTNPYGFRVVFNAAAPNDTTRYFHNCVDNVGLKFQVNSNGGIQNFQSNDSNLCDEREKKSIVSLENKWDKVKSWELKKFHYNEDADTDALRYGVIAQQVEAHCPEVLTDWIKVRAEDAVLDEDGNVVKEAVTEVARKGVKEQQMMWIAIKALQEAQTRIETLETKVAALEAA